MNKGLKFDERIIAKAISKFHEAADKIEKDCAYSGTMHDGGASRMRSEVIAYEAGLRRIIPSFLEPFVKQIEKEEDPEYSKFLELKRKFE